MSNLLRRAALALVIAIAVLSGSVDVATAAGARAVPPTTASAGASGAFTAAVDFTTVQVRDVRGNKCQLTVRGTLTFTGTLTGTAQGTTTAVIFAPCAEATAARPGTFFDVFRFTGAFTGTIAGTPVSGGLTYAGITRPGGTIEARIILRGDRAKAVLRADARVAAGGSYTGVAKVA